MLTKSSLRFVPLLAIRRDGDDAGHLLVAGLFLKRMQFEVSRSFSELVYVGEILQQLLFKGHPGVMRIPCV